jgi:hypothetical protein
MHAFERPRTYLPHRIPALQNELAAAHELIQSLSVWNPAHPLVTVFASVSLFRIRVSRDTGVGFPMTQKKKNTGSEDRPRHERVLILSANALGLINAFTPSNCP